MQFTQTRDRSRLVRVVTVTIAVAFLFGSAITSALADHVGLAGSDFESEDGNLKIDSPATHIDWENADGHADIVNFATKDDVASGSGDDAFGQGSKEDTACPVPVTGSIPPNKSDLKSFGLAVETQGSNSFLHMFWTRVQDPKGTTNMDFEFNQKDPDTDPCSNGVTPERTAGDALITYNLSKGGEVPFFFLHRWLTSGSDPCEASNSKPCWSEGVQLDTSGDATGSVNTVAIPVGDFGGPLDAFTFGEGSVNLSAVFPEGECFNFGNAYLKSRSSDSFTSALKDFIAPLDFELQNCGSLKIVKQDDLGSNLAGAKFKIYKDDGDGIFEPGTDDTQVGSECTTTADGTGDCTFDDLLFGDYWVDETQVPDGHTADPAGPKLVTVDEPKTFTVTFTNPRAPAQVTVKKVDDSDDAVPLSGATFTLFVDNDPFGPTGQHGAEDTNTGLSCTTGGDGTCTIENIFTTGGHWIVETVVPAGHSGAADQWVDISLGDDIDLTGTPFVNERLHTIIVLVCHSDGTLAPSDVENGSDSGTTIGSAPSFATEGQLCSLDGARFEDKEHGNKNMTVDVGSDAHS